MSSKQAKQPPKLLEDLKRLSDSDPVLKEMIGHKMTLDREHYIAMNWGPGVPRPWTAEHEDQLPMPFQLNPPGKY